MLLEHAKAKIHAKVNKGIASRVNRMSTDVLIADAEELLELACAKLNIATALRDSEFDIIYNTAIAHLRLATIKSLQLDTNSSELISNLLAAACDRFDQSLKLR